MRPIDFILEQFGSNDSMTLEFSKYIYKPQAIDDEREVFTVEAVDLSSNMLDKYSASLRSDQEIAVHSRVKVGNKYMHIPMADLACEFGVLRQSFGLLREILFSRFRFRFYFFSSGNSAHIYGDRLISRDQWLKLNGLLLLCNLPGKEKIVDDRWIGHRLLAGYSSLRITCNSNLSINTGKRPPEMIIGLAGDD